MEREGFIEVVDIELVGVVEGIVVIIGVVDTYILVVVWTVGPVVVGPAVVVAEV